MHPLQIINWRSEWRHSHGWIRWSTRPNCRMIEVHRARHIPGWVPPPDSLEKHLLDNRRINALVVLFIITTLMIRYIGLWDYTLHRVTYKADSGGGPFCVSFFLLFLGSNLMIHKSRFYQMKPSVSVLSGSIAVWVLAGPIPLVPAHLLYSILCPAQFKHSKTKAGNIRQW